MNGILLVDKPAGITSHDVVDHIRKAARMKRIGHTGTLDPAATGLLVLCLGNATRLSEHLTGLDKVYEGCMRLGIITDSHDLDGKVIQECPVPELDLPAIQAACDRFTGDIMQVPPMVSAVKVGGQRLYKKARHGEEVEREPRPVTVSEFVVTAYDPPDATIRVRCTRGTYVRSLCHDVGDALGCGAVLAALRRTFVGHFSLENAHPMAAFTSPEEVVEHLILMEEALDLPVVVVKNERRSAVASGTALTGRDLIESCQAKEGWVQIKTTSGKLLALGQIQQGPMGFWIHPKRVLCG